MVCGSQTPSRLLPFMASRIIVLITCRFLLLVGTKNRRRLRFLVPTNAMYLEVCP